MRSTVFSISEKWISNLLRLNKMIKDFLGDSDLIDEEFDRIFQKSTKYEKDVFYKKLKTALKNKEEKFSVKLTGKEIELFLNY